MTWAWAFPNGLQKSFPFPKRLNIAFGRIKALSQTPVYSVWHILIVVSARAFAGRKETIFGKRPKKKC